MSVTDGKGGQRVGTMKYNYNICETDLLRWHFNKRLSKNAVIV